jgi:hypothetical protein
MAVATPTQTVQQQSVQLLPEYQERFLKDLLANVYATDPTTGQVSGIAAISPLMGVPQFDEQGNPIYKMDPRTGQPMLDQYGQPIQEVVGGVPRPDIITFTPAQEQAIRMMTEGGIGLYEPMFQAAAESLGGGLGAYEEGRAGLAGTAGAYDPRSYRAFYDPFVEDVIRASEADIQRQADIERQRIGGAAVQAGAFGGSRQAVAEQELARNAARQMAETGAQLRSAAFTGAQQQAQTAFENQMRRGQSAAQIFGQLGQGIGQLGVQQAALGEAAQAAAQRDVNALFNVGALEQAQRQSEYDVQRAAAIEEAYEPFQRFSYMSDILRGIPSTSSTLTARSVPTPNPVSSILGTAQALSSMPGGSAGGILGGLMNPSGVRR